MEALREARAQQEESVATLRVQYLVWADERTHLEQVIEGQRVKLQALDSFCEQLTAQVADVTQQCTALATASHSHCARVDEARAALERAHDELASMHEAHARLQVQTHALTAALASNAELLAATQGQLRDAQVMTVELAETRAALALHQAREHQLQADRDELLTQLCQVANNGGNAESMPSHLFAPVARCLGLIAPR